MKLSFTYRAKVIKSFLKDEILDDSVNDLIIKGFPPFDTDIARFFDKNVRVLGVSGGAVEMVKLDREGQLGIIASVKVGRRLTNHEIERVSKEMTDQMNELYFGPDGIFCDFDNGGYYVLPVHPDYEIAPIKIEIDEQG